MAAQVVVLAGPAGVGKTARLLTVYQEQVGRAEPGGALWISPNWRAVEELRRGLLTHRPGCFAPGIMTFDRFAEAVVEYGGVRARLIDGSMQRWLIWGLVEEGRRSGKIRYFAQIAHTPGFIDLVTDWIRELKRLEIWPDQFHQACQAKGMTDKDRELLGIYRAYQDLLTQHDLYDTEGRFWLARTLLGQGALLPPAGRQSLELVVVDGFTDFTRTQHEILEHLANRAERLLISLPLEKDTERKELFAKPLKTLREIGRRHRRLEVEWLERPARPAWPALDHIERFLFANPRQYQALEQKAQRIEILAAASPLAELQLLAKRIKQLLTEGDPEAEGPVRPDDILVLFRSLDAVATLVREVFGRYGIPFALESSVPLRSARSVLVLGELMELVVEDWPLRRLLAVVNHSYFQPDWPQWQQGRAALVTEQILRLLGIPGGRKELFEALGRLADSEDQGHSEDPKAPQAKTALALLERLAEVLDALPQKATLSGWAKAWRRLAEQVGIFRAISMLSGSDSQTAASVGADLSASDMHPSANGEESAWEELENLLEGADRLWSWLGQPAPEPDRQQALAVLTDLLRRTSLPFRSLEAGRVRVLSVWTARPLRAPYVFLAGLSEKAFPLPEPADRFYTEQEIQHLIEQNLPLARRQDRTCEEMLLFYEAVTRATRRLVLSYAGLDESAQPLAPSPYLDELEAVCGPGQIEKQELFELRPIPVESMSLSPRDFRVRAMADALQGQVELLAGLVQAEAAQASLVPPQASRLPVQGRCLPAQAPTLSGQAGEKSGFARQPGQNSSQPQPGSLGDLREPERTWPSCAAEETCSLAENILAAIGLIDDRSQLDSFGPGEGMFQTAAGLAALQEQFGPECIYSATVLEKYARCPFRFFVEDVLRLEPPEELELEEDEAERGLWTHQILAEVHRRVNQRLGRAASPTELEEPDWQTLLHQVIEAAFAHKPPEPVRAAMQEVHRRRIRQWLADYRRCHQNYDQNKQWADFAEKPKPTYFEVAFGRAESASKPRPDFGEAVAARAYPPLELTPPQPTEVDLPKVRISGRIDRIDLGRVAGQMVFNILDYKTGQAGWPSSKRNAKKLQEALQRGTLVQLPLYVLAARQVILADQQAQPWFAGYWRIQAAGRKSPLSGFVAARIKDGSLRPTEEWKYIHITTLHTVFRLVGAIRNGQFPVFNPDPNCTRNCPWKTACRIQQVRALEKLWPPATEQQG
jgi:ATP-dependent helicase/DNAse subunit B